MNNRLQCAMPSDWYRDFSQCLYEWQGLEGAVLALLAAILSISALRRQIAQADRLENERLDRQHNAVRATLPLTLSGLIENCRLMIVALDLIRRSDFDGEQDTDFALPPPPSEHIAELQLVITSCREAMLPSYIGKIIQEFQTLYARTATLNDHRERRRRVGLKREIDTWIMQAAKIHALVEGLFEYARYEALSPPRSVGWDRVEAAIFQRGIERAELVEVIRQGLAISPYFWSSER